MRRLLVSAPLVALLLALVPTASLRAAPPVVRGIDVSGTVPSLAVDSTGAPRVAYLADGEIRYATATVLRVRAVLPLVLQRASP